VLVLGPAAAYTFALGADFKGLALKSGTVPVSAEDKEEGKKEDSHCIVGRLVCPRMTAPHLSSRISPAASQSTSTLRRSSYTRTSITSKTPALTRILMRERDASARISARRPSALEARRSAMITCAGRMHLI
jgi:hypothetical protein